MGGDIMAIHIKEFNIGAFKGIENLSLKELNHINILTGDNNTGKTSVLELLYTINNPEQLKYWYSNRLGLYSYKGMPYNYLINLFPVDYGLEHSINYRYTDCYDAEHRVDVLGEIEELLMTQQEIMKYEYETLTGKTVDNMTFGEKDEINRVIEIKKLNINIKKDLSTGNTLNIFDFESRLRSSLISNNEFKITYISPVAHSEITPLNISNILSSRDLSEEMIAILQEFDENIININAIERNGYVEYMVMTKNHKNALPLNFYGDGMKKALLLLSSMLYSKDGVLLLDEFETAIHTSAMDHIFSWLLNSALKLNVQVFLTSHSKEAINKVLRCDKEICDKISYYTLFNYEGKNLVRKLSCDDAIKLQDQGGMDIR